jgi:hypothetical protein
MLCYRGVRKGDYRERFEEMSCHVVNGHELYPTERHEQCFRPQYQLRQEETVSSDDAGSATEQVRYVISGLSPDRWP